VVERSSVCCAKVGWNPRKKRETFYHYVIGERTNDLPQSTQNWGCGFCLPLGIRKSKHVPGMCLTSTMEDSFALKFRKLPRRLTTLCKKGLECQAKKEEFQPFSQRGSDLLKSRQMGGGSHRCEKPVLWVKSARRTGGPSCTGSLDNITGTKRGVKKGKKVPITGVVTVPTSRRGRAAT